MSIRDSLVELEVGSPAHGGSCVARHEGRVVFVRHGLPGERVLARVTEESKHFARADVVEVLAASQHRVVPPCRFAGPGGCGGCDWQHADAGYQRQIKAEIVAEQLRRLAGIEREVVVEAPPGEGFGWRTRVRFAVDDAGRAGFRRYRSHHVIAVDRCLIAHSLVEQEHLEQQAWTSTAEVEVAVSASSGERCVRTSAGPEAPLRVRDGGAVHEVVAGRRFRVSPGGFWQVHPAAGELLTAAVLSGLAPREGERALDLYAGVGLFAAALAGAVGPNGSVVAVESARVSAADGVHNLSDLPQAQLVRADVATVLATSDRLGSVDIAVLDPPRSGAGAGVVRALAALRPRAIAYVACDPAALARDLATFGECGYELDQLRAFDIFPQTHHVECVAVLVPRRGDADLAPRGGPAVPAPRGGAADLAPRGGPAVPAPRGGDAG